MKEFSEIYSEEVYIIEKLSGKLVKSSITYKLPTFKEWQLLNIIKYVQLRFSSQEQDSTPNTSHGFNPNER